MEGTITSQTTQEDSRNKDDFIGGANRVLDSRTVSDLNSCGISPIIHLSGEEGVKK